MSKHCPAYDVYALLCSWGRLSRHPVLSSGPDTVQKADLITRFGPSPHSDPARTDARQRSAERRATRTTLAGVADAGSVAQQPAIGTRLYA